MGVCGAWPVTLGAVRDGGVWSVACGTWRRKRWGCVERGLWHLALGAVRDGGVWSVACGTGRRERWRVCDAWPVALGAVRDGGCVKRGLWHWAP
ncbi:hypothetical protein NDU88_001075 [Pleurodeles waltl]|uniref:Uncharacterized protein n=1 Tax=Pleurodeles waltl TaxID=8319 RepID=A0AAV7P623_PLEWA|nr:hypothetical protein NDU88_001075 [Pleurodeles waltl]